MAQNLEQESWKTPQGAPTSYFILEFMLPESVTPAAIDLASTASRVPR